MGFYPGRAVMSWFAGCVFRLIAWRARRRTKTPRAEPSSFSTEAGRPEAQRLVIGRAGETLAYWYLRARRYTIVARNRRLRPDAGELDLVGWDGPILAFIEVKTRSSWEAGPPELAVTPSQQQRIRRAAQLYLRKLKRVVTYRFDVVSVTHDVAKGFEVKLFKDAFRG